MSHSLSGPDQTRQPPGDGLFATTHWSLVVCAASAEEPEAQKALGRLCQEYWYPLYAYVRRLGHDPHQAQDFVQGYFEHLLSRGLIRRADPARGRFRTFLLSGLKHFLADAWDRARAQKRGGGQVPIYLDAQSGESRYLHEPQTAEDPEILYDRGWALQLLECAMARVRSAAEASGMADRFVTLCDMMLGERPGMTYAEAAAVLGMTEGAVKVAVHRLRGQFRDSLRTLVAETIDRPEDLEDELRHIFASLGR